VDNNGYLVTSSGLRVQGYSDAGLDDARATSRSTTPARPRATPRPVQGYSIGADGKVSVLLADGTSFTRGQVLLQNFTDPQQLMKCR
jgi:flagellar hook protein FlgE